MPSFYTVGAPGPRRIFLAVPSYGPASTQHWISLLRTLPQLDRGYVLGHLSGYCDVNDARNILVREFLATDCERLVFLDADTTWAAADLLALLDHDVPVVGGVVPLKTDEERYGIRLLPGPIQAREDGLLEVEVIGAAFLSIDRTTLETLAEKAEHFREGPDEPETPLIFERSVREGRRVSSDFEFCRRCRDQGVPIHVMPELRGLGHVGEKHWTGVFGAYLRRANGLTMPQLLARIRENVFEDQEECLAWMREAITAWGNPVWSVGPHLAMALVEVAREADGLILECGSGLSSLLLAAANPDVPVVALEHDPVWAETVRRRALQYGLGNLRVKKTPLKNGWYDMNTIDLPPVAMVLIDGPPRHLGDRSRVFDEVALASGAVVAWDDAGNMPDLEQRLGVTIHVFNDGDKPYAMARLDDQRGEAA